MCVSLFRSKSQITITDLKYLFIFFVVLPSMLMTVTLLAFPFTFSFLGFVLSCFFAIYCLDDDRSDEPCYTLYEYLEAETWTT